MSVLTLRRGALGALAVVALALPLLPRLLGPKRPRFPYAITSLSEERRRELTADAAWELTQLSAKDGVTLNALLRRPQSPAAPWILFCSGNDPTPLSTAKKFVESVRGDHDWGVFTWAYRGADSSGGEPRSDLLAQDAALVLEHLISREKVEPARVHAVGFSCGGYVGARLAGEVAKSGKALASVSLLAPAADIEMVMAGWKQKLFVGDVWEIAPFLADVPAPVLVLQGEADETVGVAQGRMVAEQLGSRAQYREFPGVRHQELLATREAADAVARFIEAHSAR